MQINKKWLMLGGGVLVLVALGLAVGLNQGGLFKGQVRGLPSDAPVAPTSKTAPASSSPAATISIVVKDHASDLAASRQRVDAGLFSVKAAGNKNKDLFGDSVLKDKVYSVASSGVITYDGAAATNESAINPDFKGVLYFRTQENLVVPAPPTVVPVPPVDSSTSQFNQPGTFDQPANGAPIIPPIIDLNAAPVPPIPAGDPQTAATELAPVSVSPSTSPSSFTQTKNIILPSSAPDILLPTLSPVQSLATPLPTPGILKRYSIPLSSSLPHAHATTADGPTVVTSPAPTPTADWTFIPNPTPVLTPDPLPAPTIDLPIISVVEDSNGIFALSPGDYPDGDYTVNVSNVDDTGAEVFDFSFILHNVNSTFSDVVPSVDIAPKTAPLDVAPEVTVEPTAPSIISPDVPLAPIETTPAILTCESPLVVYQAQCVDPAPACQNPPAHSTACTDKIENGVLIYNDRFGCLDGYTRSGNECVSNIVVTPLDVTPPETPATIVPPAPEAVAPPEAVTPPATSPVQTPVVTPDVQPIVVQPAVVQPAAVQPAVTVTQPVAAAVTQPSAQPCIVNGKLFYLAQGPNSAYCKDLQDAQVLQTDQPASTLGVRYTTALSALRILQELGVKVRARNLSADWYAHLVDADRLESASTQELTDFRTVYADGILTGRVDPRDHSVITLAPLDEVNFAELLSIYQHTIVNGMGVPLTIDENNLPGDILLEYKRNPDWRWIAEAYSFGVKYKMITKNQFTKDTIFNLTTRGNLADFVAKFKAAVKANPSLLTK
jgi:hypothetical protein